MNRPANRPPRSRRAFVLAAAGSIGACYAAAIGYPLYRYLASPVEKAAAAGAVTEVTLADAHKLPLGAVLMFRFGSKPGLLIHHRDDTWVAMDAVCTHLGCTVQYQPDRDRVYCACHGGVYDARTGANVGGPPPRPLRLFKVSVGPAAVVISRA